MASILPFVRPHDGSFGPELTRIMGEAYDAARKQLHVGQPDIVYEIIAARIIAAAKKGERDPDKLCESALRGGQPEPTTEDVASWMVTEFERTGFLDQASAAGRIRTRFGEKFIYTNQHENIVIATSVLRAFRKRTENTAVWHRGQRMWRRRSQRDEPGRRQT